MMIPKMSEQIAMFLFHLLNFTFHISLSPLTNLVDLLVEGMITGFNSTSFPAQQSTSTIKAHCGKVSYIDYYFDMLISAIPSVR